MRKAVIERNTTETQVKIEIDLDGKGKYKVSTGVKFLDHMIELFSKHSKIDVEVKAKGDLDIDQHHTVEDIGIVFGQAFKKALGDMKGINRAGFFAMPMDEALAIAAIDICGRPNLKFDVKLKKDKVGDLDTDIIKDFFKAFVDNLKCSLHIREFDGETDHHTVEAVFKGFGKALAMAVSKDKKLLDSVPSTKGVI